MMRAVTRAALLTLLSLAAIGSGVSAQTPAAPPAAPPSSAKPAQPPAEAPKPQPAPATPTAKPATAKPAVPVAQAQAPLPEGYVIGPDDILIIVFWREKELSTEAVVRPDGRISIPLLQDVEAAGLTPEQLRDKLNAQAQKLVEDPNATVVVKEINSRKAFITGMVSKPGPYRLTAPTTVVQLIAMAGGLLEYADKENITVVRMENGMAKPYRFNYKDITERRNLQQNIALQPGDTVLVP